MEKGIKAKGKVENATLECSFIGVGLKTSLFCRFWISSSCNLSVRSHNSFSPSVFRVSEYLVCFITVNSKGYNSNEDLISYVGVLTVESHPNQGNNRQFLFYTSMGLCEVKHLWRNFIKP